MSIVGPHVMQYGEREMCGVSVHAQTHTYSHSLTYIYTPIHHDYANIYSLVSLIKDDGNTDAGMNALEHHISPIL